MAHSSAVRVLVAHADGSVRRNVRSVLAGRDSVEVVAEADDLASTGQKMRRTHPDVVLLDPDLIPDPGRPGSPDPLAALCRAGVVVVVTPATVRLLSAVGDPRRSSAAHRLAFALTPRELDVIALMCTGADNSSIAAELFISTKTVKNHTNSIFNKLGAASRVEAVATWLGTRPVRFPAEPPAAPSSGIDRGEIAPTTGAT